MFSIFSRIFFSPVTLGFRVFRFVPFSNDVSPDSDLMRDNQKFGDKYKELGNIQTYRLVKL